MIRLPFFTGGCLELFSFFFFAVALAMADLPVVGGLTSAAAFVVGVGVVGGSFGVGAVVVGGGDGVFGAGTALFFGFDAALF